MIHPPYYFNLQLISFISIILIIKPSENKVANELYSALENEGISCIFDDRNVNPGTEESPNTTKAISPKNRRFTLSLGILNSQNEFVDITKTLCRWEKDENRDWNIKKYSSEYSDIFKFNDGYFIPDEFDNSSLDETIEDSRLIGVRKINR